MPRYPIYVISKGRYQNPLTARFLIADGVPFHMVVEPQEADAYAAAVGRTRLLVLPFSNLGLGSIPARTWVWEHSLSRGHERHWILDDNIQCVYRYYNGFKIRCNSECACTAVEDFTDRYENIGIAGLNYEFFAPRSRVITPFILNTHVYSFLLILNALPHRWRGRYNEDTDLCLQVLSAGWCTVLVNAFLAKKLPSMTMTGGNTDELYKGDGRLKMARSLERMWPGVVEVKRRFKRPQHVINWKKFDTPLKLKPGIDITDLQSNEYGMKLTQVRQIKSKDLQQLLRDQMNKDRVFTPLRQESDILP